MHSETESTSTSAEPPPPRIAPRRSAWIAAAVVGGAALVVAAIIALTGERPREVRVVSGSAMRTSPAPGAKFFWEGGSGATTIDTDEIISGGPPPDGIPPIDEPSFVTAAQADWLAPREPVMALVHKGEARAYPLQVMTWHEIVNDEIGGDPITVTFCPLCNSAIAFDRRVATTPDAQAMLGAAEAVLDFGTSGRLYRSNLVMYDRQTKSLWIQFTGQSVVGPFVKTELRTIPVQIVSWDEVRAAHPDVKVLSRDTGFRRDYGRNPYAGYDDVDATPFLFEGPSDGRLKPMERVVAVRHGRDAVAVRLADLQKRASGGSAVLAETVGGRQISVFFKTGTASALDDSSLADGRDVGATGVFLPAAGGRSLTFRATGGAFVDDQTGSTWNVLGEAVGGPLAGTRLEGVVHDDTFWFVWAAFRPKTRIFGF